MDEETLTKESRIAPQSLSVPQHLRHPGRLPSEILVQVFLLSLPPPDHHQAPQKTALSLVCRFWYLVVDSTPTLWSRISSSDSIQYVRKSLSKSGEHAIDVSGDLSCARSYDAYSNFLADIELHTRRWRHVALQVLSGRGFTLSITTLPFLQTLKLYSSYPSTLLDDQCLSLLNFRQAPFLREVSLCSLGIHRWDLISFSPTLSVLEISHVLRDYPLIAGWLSVIAECPNLTVFRLREVVTSVGDGLDGAYNTAALVELTALQELDLYLVQFDLVIHLLKRLKLPDECAVSIRCTVKAFRPSTAFLTPALSNQRNFQSAGKATQVDVHLTDFHYYLTVAYRRWHIKLDLDGGTAIRDALEWFGIRGENRNAASSSSHSETSQAGFPMLSDTPVTLAIGPSSFRYDFGKLTPMDDIRNITRIEINRFLDYEIQSFLSYLSGPENPDGPTRMSVQGPLNAPLFKRNTKGVWPFPGLRELVRNDSSDDAVYYLLVEPIVGGTGDSATAGALGRAARWELLEPNTQWKKAV